MKPGKWYYNELMKARLLGIISGDSSGRFYPDEPITRAEAAVMIYRVLEK